MAMLLEGYTLSVVSSFEVYAKGQPLSEGEWHNDGSKLLVRPVFVDAHGGPRTGMAITCGQFQLIVCVHGPQTSYNTELRGLCVHHHLR